MSTRPNTMLRSALLILLTLVIALAGGAASVAWVLGGHNRFGAVNIGPWYAFPDAGTKQADPYHRAQNAIDGVLTLGQGEGITFIADRDTSGAALTADCQYRLSGQMPAGRFWTLRAETAADRDEATPPSPSIHSRELLRQPDNSVTVMIGKKPVPGNWLNLGGDGRQRLVLTVYDPAATGGPTSEELKMPSIERSGCDA